MQDPIFTLTCAKFICLQKQQGFKKKVCPCKVEVIDYPYQNSIVAYKRLAELNAISAKLSTL